jgi:signal transduction histidine kinase
LYRISNSDFSKKDQFVNEKRIIESEENDYRILQHDFVYDKIYYELEIGSSLSEIEDLTFVIRFFVIVVLLFIVIFTFLIDTFYIEYLLKPFYKIIDKKIRRVNQPENFDETPIISHSSDFQELDTVLNEMMNRISELFKKEKQFIANVSHELLTPIALLKNKFENLLQNKSLNNNAVDKIASALKTLDLLKKVINNLLLISRIENNQYQINENINLNEMLMELVENLEDRIQEKNIMVSQNLQKDNFFVGNQTLIHVLLYNLITNAIKYNVPNGEITITDKIINNHYQLSISDTGIGMNKSQVNHIFQRFARVSQDQEGHGLGLAIVDSIANFHHIQIDVNSSLEQGTSFVLNFPEQ